MSPKKKKVQLQDLKTENLEEKGNLNEKIQEKAYELYEKRGCCHGQDCNDWYEAEKLVKSGK